MLDTAAPNLAEVPLPADPQPDLLADAYWHLIRTLRLALPPPPEDTPEDLSRRDRAAIARIAALAPANAVEADLAAQFVAASDHWKDCLRLAQLPEPTSATAAQCRRLASGMMRQSLAALRLLLRMQEARRKLEADREAADRLAWTEHCAARLMAEGLAAQPSEPRTGSGPAKNPPEPQTNRGRPVAGQSNPAAPGLPPANAATEPAGSPRTPRDLVRGSRGAPAGSGDPRWRRGDRRDQPNAA